MLDAGINRAAEGLRVLEDIARFQFDNKSLSSKIRKIRHAVRDKSRGMDAILMASRDAENDVGIATSFSDSADQRKSISDTSLSNFKRVQESLRSIEEILKTTGDYEGGKNIELLRFTIYAIEPKFMSLFTPKLPHGIYGILGEKYSLGRSNIEVARAMVAGGIDVLQYREKLSAKSLREIFLECSEIRKITADAGIPFIVNDFAEIAVMVKADGIHQGQDDLPIRELKKVAPRMMLGCSTHSPEQARKAISDGADYIGVGPLYATTTKEDVCDTVGLEYLEHVVRNHDIPFVAIGGIKRQNLAEVVRLGARTICLVTEIIGAKNIAERIKAIKQIIGENQ